jgi:hypothetical protein
VQTHLQRERPMGFGLCGDRVAKMPDFFYMWFR